jgi:hypothetical protein
MSFNEDAVAIKDALRPRLSEAEDSTVAVLVWAIGVAGAVIIAIDVFGHAEVRKIGLPALGGILLLLSAYFTARSLLYNSRASFIESFMRASELYSSSDVVRMTAGKAALQRLYEQAKADEDRLAVERVLNARLERQDGLAPEPPLLYPSGDSRPVDHQQDDRDDEGNR